MIRSFILLLWHSPGGTRGHWHYLAPQPVGTRQCPARMGAVLRGDRRRSAQAPAAARQLAAPRLAALQLAALRLAALRLAALRLAARVASAFLTILTHLASQI